MCPSGTALTPTASASASGEATGFRSAFEVLDADRDGKIGRDDLRAFYSALPGPSAAADESAIGSMISAADSNRDGFVEYDEFERVLGAGEAAGGLMEEVFAVMDKDGDGKLSHADLKSYMHSAGFSAADEDIAAMIALANGGDDRDRDHVSFQGLLKILAVDRFDFDSV